MLRQLAISIATLITLSHSQWVHAEAWFEVEVYVFERQSSSTEQWPNSPVTFNANKAIDLISPVVGQAITPMSTESAACTLTYDADANTVCAETGLAPSVSDQMGSSVPKVAYRYPGVIPANIGSGQVRSASANGAPVLLASSQGQFSSIVSSISRQRGTRSLLHMTWQQPMRSKSAAVPVRLFAGKDFSKSYHYDGRRITVPNATEKPMADVLDGTSSAVLPTDPVWELDGTLNIYLSHYLYIESALNLRREGRKMMPVQPDNELAPPSATVQKVMTPYLMSIPLVQNRRVKSEEIHYLDHPEMGLVIQIRKMAQPSAQLDSPAPYAVQTVGQY